MDLDVQINVDKEVYQALEGRVRRFGDSPNSVLRDLLGLRAFPLMM
ncbi:MAG: hypothetical protein ACLPT4_12860 [Verrucomicrobiia bacterium]